LPRLFFEHFTSTSLLVERPDGRLVAFLVGFLSPSEPAAAYVHVVGVDPSMQRAGVGRALYQRFLDDAARQGARTVRCITSPGNAASLAFHTALGFFVEVGDGEVDGVPVLRDHDGPGRHRVRFLRRLEPPDAVRDLAVLVAAMSPCLHEGEYVFTSVRGPVPAGADPVATVVEDEGRTLVVPREQADAIGLPYTFVAGWITLRVRSALDAVGLTAAVSRALADAGISANVVAGCHHDHLFVPHDRADAAVRALEALSRCETDQPETTRASGPGK